MVSFLTLRRKSFDEYVWFVAKHQSRSVLVFLVIDLLLLATGLVGYALNINGAWYALLGPVARASYGGVKLRRAIRQFLQQDWKVTTAHVFQGSDSPLVLSKVQPSDRQSRLGFEQKTFGKETVLWSPAINETLRSKDWTCITSEVHAELVKHTINSNRELCIRLLTRKWQESSGRQLFNNENKWSLASELDPSRPTVMVHENGYFDSYCTNEACTKIMRSTTGDVRSGLSMFPIHYTSDGIAHLDDLEVAPVNNHVGVSTLAISADRYLKVHMQLIGWVNTGKIVATGSGSGDIGDLDVGSLRRTVICGMERELREEGLLRKGTSEANTEILGFFRWLSRGGKPEFIGITRLSMHGHDMQPDEHEVGSVVTEDGRRMQSLFFVENVDAVPKAVAEIRKLAKVGKWELSLPLQVILSRLEQLSISDPTTLSRLLYGE